MKPLSRRPTSQKAYDAVLRHFLIEGNERSTSSEGNCLFRGINGTVCAVGLLIPDRLYHRDMENCPLEEVLSEFQNVEYWLERCSFPFLQDLQIWHDRTDTDLTEPDSIEKFREIGIRYGLDVSGLSAVPK